jgi:hypothetical protein
MPKPAREVIAGLQRKGFASRENDHTFLQLWVANKKTPIYTKVSHGEKEIPDNLLSAMARQLRLNRKQFLELVDCALTLEQYTAILRTGSHIS